jgi:hypothetical protein
MMKTNKVGEKRSAHPVYQFSERYNGHWTSILVSGFTGPIHLLEGIFMKGQYGVMDALNHAVTEIATFIAAIPVKDRAEDTAAY